MLWVLWQVAVDHPTQPAPSEPPGVVPVLLVCVKHGYGVTDVAMAHGGKSRELCVAGVSPVCEVPWGAPRASLHFISGAV